ncbi:serine/arginine repetitive matrix protein 1-like isoform X2 [Tribolium madens]|uniref:serine/arginine repetitive matrix protein 1-like isoform X2 n=1 Tax=Tribolium madens TaxID=41895 RepID=UPI001CF746D2|nr:serine/arginine repetitive matrix protein 1-like isoform X2 [Tribolium madens]
MEDNVQLSFPEEDEDLEALRLAALQSLKRKSANEAPHMSFGGVKDKGYFNGSPRGKHKRGKFSRLQQGRTCRNGQFNGWTRNSNLIAVPMVTEEENKRENVAEEAPKLILPQDRYCKVEKSPEKSDQSSKFDRYDNSDESEDESEEEASRSETEEKSELTRSNSLEALMAELENEIQGVTPEKSPPKPKKKRKVTASEPDPKVGENSVKENLKPEPEIKPNFRRKWQKPRRPFHPPSLVHTVVPPPPVVTFAPPPVPPFPPFMAFDSVYAPPIYDAPPPQLPPLHVAPPLYERPISPLAINTDFGNGTLAPLSPRSAAFVMENRAIIEKRKRRSYSRSPTPVRFRKRASLSPLRRSLSPSPVRKVSPRPSPKKQSSVRERLGSKNEELKKEDPVLEARRRKFERKEITVTEGVIRLKKPETDEEKKEEEAEEEEEIDEDALLEGDDSIILDPKLDTLFSDEESDSDNEGRFKTKQETNQKVPVLPFTKLINGAKSEVKTDLRLEKKKTERRKRFRSRTPLKKPEVKLTNERKIEIKIRNPAKYEKTEPEEKVRKVEVTDEKPEEKVETSVNEGDLRTQLSRKRAERQKHPLPDVVPSRLLQNALQGVGFRKVKKSKKEENAEGKLPIHLRLGAATEPSFGKKSRKQKKGSQEQDIITTHTQK